MPRTGFQRPGFDRRATLAVGVALAVLLAVGPTRAQRPTTVAISQIIEHPDLDNVRRGTIEGLKQAGVPDPTIVYESAQGDVATAVQIAKRFVGLNPDLIVAIGTPAAQAVTRATKTTAVVFGGIADPVGAGLVTSLDRPGGNVTGTRSFTPVEPQFDLIAALVPQARRIGIINNPAEANSRAAVDAFTKAGSDRGYAFVREVVTSSSETLTAASNLVGKVDAIWVPTDSTVVSSLEAVVRVATANKIPLFTAETGGVNRGALASLGLDWRQVGLKTGAIAARILKGEKPSVIPVEPLSDVTLRLNARVGRLIGIPLPTDLVAKAGQIVE